MAEELLKPALSAADNDDAEFDGEEVHEGSAAEDVNDEFVEISEELQRAFDDVKDKATRRDLVSRRMQVRDAWEQRYFDRGNQHLVEGPFGQWGYDGETSQGTRNAGNDERHDTETNIYQAYRLQITGVLTQNNPTVHFFPVDNKQKIDNTTACAANKLKQIVERDNNMISVQEDIVRYLYTDSLAVIQWVWDKKQNKQIPKVGGTLEWKLPIQVNYLNECFYAIGSREIDIVVAKNKYPAKAKDIKASTAPAAESEFERLARVACMQGMRPAAMTGDSLQWNVTEQLSFIKPDGYNEITDEALRAEAEEKFPDGVCLHHCGSTFCGARPARMDDELTLLHAFSGDGMHRNSIGKSLVNIQKKLNNCVELLQQTLMNTIPVKWTHPSYVDLPALSQQKNTPGSYLKLAAIPPNGDLSNAFYVEEQLQVPEVLLNWILQLRDNFAQLLTGAYPALTGAGDLGGNDTAQGIAMERDAAMGRIGAIWRSLKEGYASIMKNAVICITKNSEGKISANIPARGGIVKHLTIDVDDLRGNVCCFPETNESYPQSWVQKRGVVMSLISSPDPQVEQTANLPENLVLVKEVLGVDGFYIPQVVSRNKQLVEIEALLASEPEPSPQAMQTAALLEQAKGAMDPAMAAQIEEQIAQMPEVSSVSVDYEYDDHMTELLTVNMFINSEEGQEVKFKNPRAFQNVRLHGMEHEAALKQKAAEQAAGPQKPVSKSVSVGDLLKAGMTNEAAQLLSQAGVKSAPVAPAAGVQNPAVANLGAPSPLQRLTR
jgi:hypothetical protein